MNDRWLGDLTLAARRIRRQPLATLFIVFILALGIGANTAMFGIVRAALLQSLPFDQAEQLVVGRSTFDGELGPTVSGYDYCDYRDQAKSFSRLGAMTAFTRRQTLQGTFEPDRAEAAWATWELFAVLRVKPFLGRLFTPDDARPGGGGVVVLSHGFWRSRLGGGTDVVGSGIRIDGVPVTVVGVLPPDFHFVHSADLWNLTYKDGPWAGARRWHNLTLVGRLRPGVTLEAAQAEMDSLSQRLQELYPESNEGKALLLTPLQDTLVEELRPILFLLTAAVALVLLLACGNVAGLLLAGGETRRSEMALRAALGAGRGQLVRQMLVESAVLACLGGAVGILLAAWAQAGAAHWLPAGPWGPLRVSLNPEIALFVLTVSLLTGLLFGSVPAFRAAATDPYIDLKSGPRAGGDIGGSRLRGGLVVAQVALSIVLLVGAGLLLRSLSAQIAADLRFDPENLLTAEVGLPETSYPSLDQVTAFHTSLVESVAALPGVKSDGLINRLPFRSRWGNIYLHPVDQAPSDWRNDLSADFRCVLPGYLKTLGIRLLAGRDISESDVADSPRVMVVSRSLAEKAFPGQDPLGRRLVVDRGEPVVHEIVGVADDARLNSLRESFPAMYMAYRQAPQRTMQLAVRAGADSAGLAAPIREILKLKDPNIPLAEPMTMASILSEEVAEYRLVTTAVSLFSGIALLLALVGLYALLSSQVARRRHEFGVRMALGATSPRILLGVLRHGFRLVVVGAAVGLPTALAAMRLIQGMLFETNAADPLTFLSAALLLVAAALLATLLPAWRATRVNPVEALQAE